MSAALHGWLVLGAIYIVTTAVIAMKTDHMPVSLAAGLFVLTATAFGVRAADELARVFLRRTLRARTKTVVGVLSWAGALLFAMVLASVLTVPIRRETCNMAQGEVTLLADA